ncbi:hypothetical protein BREVNS_1680 [Brevinematales bacterium NS]|nr:hypothetical protein BREVNS_1680 [Brevinematales bacterium NS]
MVIGLFILPWGRGYSLLSPCFSLGGGFLLKNGNSKRHMVFI